MSDWPIWVAAVPLTVAGLFGLVFAVSHVYYRRRLLANVVRIFEEKPLFVIPRGQADPSAEDVTLRAVDGVLLRGCYFPRRPRFRRGVILFGLEFGSNRWAAGPYCERLREAGYDVFAFEPRNQGESEADPNYAPLQWVTDKDVADARAALDYLTARPDADPRGVGYFGVSKGGSVGLVLAATSAAVRCIVTDGAYAVYTTMLPYMRRWVSIYSKSNRWFQRAVPDFFYGAIGTAAVRKVSRRRRVRFPWIDREVKKLAVPTLMIHGEADTYIKADMARTLFAKVGAAQKELWLVPKAKHNQAHGIAAEEYHARLVAFFQAHLSDLPEVPADASADATETLPFPQPVSGEHTHAAAAREVAPMPSLAAVAAD